MAYRNKLHLSHLKLLDEFMDREGYILLANKSIYEVRRYKNKRLVGDMKTVIIYKRDNQSSHCTVMDKHIKLINEFLREIKSMEANNDNS